MTIEMRGTGAARELRLPFPDDEVRRAFREEAAERGGLETYEDDDRAEMVLKVGTLSQGEVFQVLASLALRIGKPWESRPDGGRK